MGKQLSECISYRGDRLFDGAVNVSWLNQGIRKKLEQLQKPMSFMDLNTTGVFSTGCRDRPWSSIGRYGKFRSPGDTTLQWIGEQTFNSCNCRLWNRKIPHKAATYFSCFRIGIGPC